MLYARIVIWLSASFFIIYGVAFSLFPIAMATIVTGVEPIGVSTSIDLRATYGGMSIAAGVTMLYLLFCLQIRTCLVMIVLLLMSMAVTRTIGLLVEGTGNVFMYLFLAGEVMGAALAVEATKKLNQCRENHGEKS